MQTSMRLSEIAEGVEFKFLWAGEFIRAVVLREVLETYFGATDSPKSWLASCVQHRSSIEAAAVWELLAHPPRSLGMVVLKGDCMAPQIQSRSSQSVDVYL